MKMLFYISSLMVSMFMIHEVTLVTPAFPNHFPEPTYDFSSNPLNEETIQLGRALFYDPILSADGTISCASCHSPYNAFAHSDHALSHGINDQVGTRNAPALFNLAWQSSFMWDGAVHHLDMQALAPLTSHQEMREDLNNVIQKLCRSDIYPELFSEAFGDETITGERFLKALSQFQLTLVSANSKYDQFLAGTAELSAQEITGLELFDLHCQSCHSGNTFSSYDFKKNGLAVDFSLLDLGLYTTTQLPADSLKFKVPSLRNLSFSKPYMHDGRFKTLREVLNHYTSLTENSSISAELKDGIQLSSDEKTDLIAFLLTLDDYEFVFNPKHTYPKEILNP